MCVLYWKSNIKVEKENVNTRKTWKKEKNKQQNDFWTGTCWRHQLCLGGKSNIWVWFLLKKSKYLPMALFLICVSSCSADKKLHIGAFY